MALIDFDTLIGQYRDKVKDKYPDIDLSHFTILCKSVFRYIRRQINSPLLPRIMIKYIGKFVVLPEKIITMMKRNKRTFDMGKITEEEFMEREMQYKKIFDMVKQREKIKKNVKSESSQGSTNG